MPRIDFKHRKLVFLFCFIIPLVSLVLLIPAVRLLVIAAAQQLVHRQLRDPVKWHRLIIRYSAVQIALSFSIAYILCNAKTLWNRGRAFASGKELHLVLFALFIICFAVQQLLYVRHPGDTGFFLNTATLWDLYVSVLGGQTQHLGMYPPLAAIFYRILSSMVPADFLSGDWTMLAYSQYGSYLALLYCLLSFVPFCLLCWCATEGDRLNKLLVTISLCCSAPFMYSLMRGNIVSISFCAAFCFCLASWSDNAFVRALGLLALLVAVGTKLYPVAFVMLLVKQKRWKDCAFLLFVSAIAFIFMLSFFDAGAYELVNMVKSIGRFTSSFKDHHNLALKRQVWDLLSLSGGEPSETLFSVVNAAVLVLYLFLSAVLFLLTKKRWVEYLLLVLACLLLPGIVRPYSEIFWVIPFVELLNCREKDLYRCLAIAFMLPMMLFVAALAEFVTFHSYLVTFPLLALCAAEVAHERRPTRTWRGTGRPL